ncbi:MAG: nucleotide exchange factor GrpE [Candidatus Poribacteria bacterium]|nr:nucleotide exchange factor GrpE [Candidatus Poribacteria bacterium]
MKKEKWILDETTEVDDIDNTDDPSLQEGQEASTEQSDGDSVSDENGEESQSESEQDETSTTDAGYTSMLTSIDRHLSKLEELFTSQITRNQNQREMFDAIYGEMKDYKENVLLEAFQKPIIHNLIQFYDNFVLVESQLVDMSETLNALGDLLTDEVSAKQLRAIRPKQRAEDAPKISDRLKRKLSDFRNNMENVRIELEEVLYRMDVEPYEEHPEKLDRKLHKTLKTIPTDDPDQDENVAAVHKTGFYWRDAVFRPEEVTILRYTPPTDESSETANANATEKIGD